MDRPTLSQSRVLLFGNEPSSYCQYLACLCGRTPNVQYYGALVLRVFIGQYSTRVLAIGQDSGRVLTRTLGEYFSGGHPLSQSLSDHHHDGPLLTYSPRLLRPLGLPLHGPPITAGHVSPHRLTVFLWSSPGSHSPRGSRSGWQLLIDQPLRARRLASAQWPAQRIHLVHLSLIRKRREP